MTEIAMYIDIEGFAQKFNNGARQSFIDLTNDLFTLGQKYFKHLAIYQFGGDGFLIKEFLTYSKDVVKFVDLATALLQSIVIRGGMGRVQISFGNMPDISGLYSADVQAQLRKEKLNLLAEYQNIMLVSPIIGTSIINCYKLSGPSGPMLLIDKQLVNEDINLPLVHHNENGYDVFAVNWLNYSNQNTNDILNVLALDNKTLLKNYKNYIESNELKEEWKIQAMSLIKEV